MTRNILLNLLLIVYGTVDCQKNITSDLILSPFVTITYDQEIWSLVSVENLQVATETRVLTKNTTYIGGIYNYDNSRQITVKYKAVLTEGLTSIEDVYLPLKEISPSIAIEYKLNAVLLDKSNGHSFVFLKPFKAGFLYITVYDQKYISYKEAVELASLVKIKEEFQGFSSRLDDIDWQKIFITGIQKALEP